MLVPAFVLVIAMTGPKATATPTPPPLQPGAWNITTSATLPMRVIETWRYCVPNATIGNLIKYGANVVNQKEQYTCTLRWSGATAGNAFCTKLSEDRTGMNVILRLNWQSTTSPDGSSARINVSGNGKFGAGDPRQPSGDLPIQETITGANVGACNGSEPQRVSML